MELGRSMQNDFQNNQRRFWSRVKAPRRGSKDVDKICDVNGQVIGDEEGVMERCKEYFSGLLQGSQQEEKGTMRNAGHGSTQEEESISIAKL